MAGVLFTQDGVQNFHIFIRTGSAEVVGSFFWGDDTGSITTDRTLESIDNVILQKPVAWAKSGHNSKFTVGLTSLEAPGSYINRGGLTTGSVTVGSLITIEESVVGSKTTSFTVNIVGEIIITPLG